MHKQIAVLPVQTADVAPENTKIRECATVQQFQIFGCRQRVQRGEYVTHGQVFRILI